MEYGLTLACGINHLYEAHPVIHQQLFSVCVFYCWVISLPRFN